METRACSWPGLARICLPSLTVSGRESVSQGSTLQLGEEHWRSQPRVQAELKSTWKYLKYSVCRSRTRSGWSLLLKLSTVSAVQGQSSRLVPYSEQKQLEEDWSDWTEVQDRRDSNSNHNNTCIV